VQEQPQPVVGEVAEAVLDTLDLLDQQVDGLGGSVGAAVGGVEAEDLDLPRLDGPGKPGQLRDLDAIAPAVEAIQAGAGCSYADRSVDRAQQLFALPGCGDLTGRISGGRPFAPPGRPTGVTWMPSWPSSAAILPAGTANPLLSQAASATARGADLHPGRAQRRRGLLGVAGLDPPLAPPAAADLHLEAADLSVLVGGGRSSWYW
jgi:hypothetical protein